MEISGIFKKPGVNGEPDVFAQVKKIISGNILGDLYLYADDLNLDRRLRNVSIPVACFLQEYKPVSSFSPELDLALSLFRLPSIAEV